MGTISFHSNQSSYPTGKKQTYFLFPLPIDAIWNMERICLTASEEMSFENVDRRRTDEGRWTPDTCLYYNITYEPTAQVD